MYSVLFESMVTVLYTVLKLTNFAKLFDNVFKFFICCIESVQHSLEKKFGKAGGTIPITPSDRFERRMGVRFN